MRFKTPLTKPSVEWPMWPGSTVGSPRKTAGGPWQDAAVEPTGTYLRRVL